MKEATTDPGVEAKQMQISALVQLAQRQPLAALAALFLLGGTGGTLGSMYVAPLIDDALRAHEANDRAHDVDRIEDRLDAIDGRLEADTKKLGDVSRTIDRVFTKLDDLTPK